MHIFGAEIVREFTENSSGPVKMVFNANDAIVFRASEQHRDQKAAGITYEDDYKGNALAAVLSNGRMEIRFHQSFSDMQVESLVKSLIQNPPLSFIRQLRVTYQGASYLFRPRAA